MHKIEKYIHHFLFITSMVLLTSFVIVIQNTNTTHALSASDFNAGNIISDSVFTNKDSMGVSQIQSFLNSKVTTCDTNGTQLSEYGGPDLNSDGKVQRWEWGKANYNQTTFPCLKDYKVDNKSAAQIIYDASQEFSINPQVLIVLLQKEQALVTDTWPLNIQYRSATGYGCPDTAACDSKYYGLTNQVRWAATMYRAIMNDSPTWYTPYILGNNYIQYNPDSSCGGSTVNIVNRATKALYNYTPYQPSAAVLDWKFNDGAYPNCGAYGNLNFFVYFNDWFGSTIGVSVKYTIYSSTTDKTGKAASFGVSLSRKPSSDVSIQYGITSPSTAEFVGQSKVVIKPSTWNSPELNKITVKGLNNTDQNGIVGYTVRASRPVTYDKSFSMLGGDTVGHVSVINQDTASSMPVYQLYSSSTDKHFYTANISERLSKITEGYGDRGIAFYYCSAGDTTIHSLATTGAEQRLEIEGSNQLNSLLSSNYSRVSIAFASSSKGKVPIYRHYNTTTDHSFYSINPSEATSQGYASQGVAFYACKQGDIPVYRLYKPSTGTHFYTTSPTMRNNVIYNGGYRYEGVAYYIQDGTIPVYRLYKPSTGTHFYTTSESDRDKVAKEGGYRYEGVAYKIQDGGTVPVYRLYKPSTGRHYYTTSVDDRDYVAENGGYIPQGISMYIND